MLLVGIQSVNPENIPTLLAEGLGFWCNPTPFSTPPGNSNLNVVLYCLSRCFAFETTPTSWIYSRFKLRLSYTLRGISVTSKHGRFKL